MTIDASSLLNSEEIAVCDGADLLLSNLERLDARDTHCTYETLVGLNESLNILRISWLADIVSNVKCKEVRSLDESVNVVEVDMVSVNEILTGIVESLYSCISLLAGLRWLCVDDLMLAVSLVPYRNELHSVLLCSDEESLELSYALVREAVTNSERIFSNCHHN